MIATLLQNIRIYHIDTLNLHVWIPCAFSGRILVSRSSCIDYTGSEPRHEPTACASSYQGRFLRPFTPPEKKECMSLKGHKRERGGGLRKRGGNMQIFVNTHLPKMRQMCGSVHTFITEISPFLMNGCFVHF